ncbi:hypothetical protein F2Q69_00016330 [Brassica cretica]|uniref:Uncharacterized protein n=2 Tax=Brassica TaxID=3705 RepID=A0A8S9QVU6_BRACR|nr:hypothetical protein F2Q69_00016330 [Brassica cretica]CAF1859984.1 unnamed protein product [Brassica napus]
MLRTTSQPFLHLLVHFHLIVENPFSRFLHEAIKEVINSLVSHKPFFTHIRRRRQRNPRDGGDTVPEIFKRSHDEASAIHGEFVPQHLLGSQPRALTKHVNLI